MVWNARPRNSASSKLKKRHDYYPRVAVAVRLPLSFAVLPSKGVTRVLLVVPCSLMTSETEMWTAQWSLSARIGIDVCAHIPPKRQPRLMAVCESIGGACEVKRTLVVGGKDLLDMVLRA